LISWLKSWIGGGVKIRIDIPWTGAEFDKCRSCGVKRKDHTKRDHPFKENEQ
jgi:hypothetical protein